MEILYVEDNKINAVVIKKMLSQYQVDIAANSDEAFLKVSEKEFDLVLMDINLGIGEMNGSEVMLHLRKKYNYDHKPIFAVTAFAMPGDKERFLNQGFDDYFSKPVALDQLQLKISELQKKEVN
ncbi:response regulator [Gangjinia marincola]|uniref:Response regulator n=1 Tax=Gangjinia marincola TaxID=578463 RepID=A0ABN1MJ05_9FLAO